VRSPVSLVLILLLPPLLVACKRTSAPVDSSAKSDVATQDDFAETEKTLNVSPILCTPKRELEEIGLRSPSRQILDAFRKACLHRSLAVRSPGQIHVRWA
jgi:hypothetical protein